MPGQPKERDRKGSQGAAAETVGNGNPLQAARDDPHLEFSMALQSPLGFPPGSLSVSSESTFQQAVAPTPRGTHLLCPKPLHHMAGVATMPTGQAEVG